MNSNNSSTSSSSSTSSYNVPATDVLCSCSKCNGRKYVSIKRASTHQHADRLLKSAENALRNRILIRYIKSFCACTFVHYNHVQFIQAMNYFGNFVLLIVIMIMTIASRGHYPKYLTRTWPPIQVSII